MNTDKPEPQAPTIDSAALSLLQNHRHGGVLNDMAAAIREVTEAVQLVGKAGRVTVTFVIEPATKIANAVVITDEVKARVPQTKPAGSFFFTDAAGNLHREDPKQISLPLRAIEGGAPAESMPLKKVNA